MNTTLHDAALTCLRRRVCLCGPLCLCGPPRRPRLGVWRCQTRTHGLGFGGAKLARVDAGWSSPVARQAHNLKVTGSNPVPATTESEEPPKAKASGASSYLDIRNPTDDESPPVRTARRAVCRAATESSKSS